MKDQDQIKGLASLIINLDFLPSFPLPGHISTSQKTLATLVCFTIYYVLSMIPLYGFVQISQVSKTITSPTRIEPSKAVYVARALSFFSTNLQQMVPKLFLGAEAFPYNARFKNQIQRGCKVLIRLAFQPTCM